MSPTTTGLALICLVALLPLTFSIGVRPKKSAGVKGYLTCNGRPAGSVRVKLYDIDRTSMDDKMDDGKTDANGFFQLQGSAREVSTTPVKPTSHPHHVGAPVGHQWVGDRPPVGGFGPGRRHPPVVVGARIYPPTAGG